MTRFLVLLVILVLAAFVLFGKPTEQQYPNNSVTAAPAAAPQSTATTTAASEAWKEVALSEVRKEPKVVEAMFPASSSFWASVRDDGTRRDGYAESLCVLLMTNGMPVGDFYVIHVWDAVKMAKKDMVELGRFDCERKG